MNKKVAARDIDDISFMDLFTDAGVRCRLGPPVGMLLLSMFVATEMGIVCCSVIEQKNEADKGKTMTYLGSEVMGSDKYVYFDTDGNLETTEEVHKVDVADLPVVRNLKVGQQVSIKDWRKVLSVQQKTRE